jgi:two-component system, response regulator / RNA-binding antiterminator
VRVLLADDDTERAGAVARVLAADSGVTVLRLSNGALLTDAVVQLSPDIVLIDMARPDRDALEGIRNVSAQATRPVVLFVDQDDPEFMEAAIGAGVSSYNVLDLKPPDVKPILRAAMALFRRHQAERDALAAAETRLRERQAVDRAKAILIKERRLDEPRAYRWLRRQSMARGKRLADIAQEIVRAKEGDRA